MWTLVDEGLYFADFDISSPIPFNDVIITIFKIDPHIYEFYLLTISEHGHPALTMPEWCEHYNLIGAINAGMYQEDMLANVGYLKNVRHINNAHVNSSHHSMAAFNPVDSTDVPFYIFDIDDYPADSVIARYHSVVQNLRLIKRPGENRWSESNKRWCEAAVGQDKKGDVLFIYCRAPLTMTELNNALLSLPINIACAMHVEGGQPASLCFSHPRLTRSYSGTNETKFDSDGLAFNATKIPNIIGFRQRSKP
ncbi:phosphodiester glycosidase family protein [candidate division KSB1 bacterium]|nr:phosphodiester glycosidase family protein [candidate division KSB1 bacterium]